jgi:hypothetical protein
MNDKHLLLISQLIPYPLTEGGNISQFAIIDYLRKYYKITLVCVVKYDNQLNDIEQLKAIWTNVSFEVINLIPALPDVTRPGIFKRVKGKIKRIFSLIAPAKIEKVDTVQSVEYDEFDQSYLVSITEAKPRAFIEQFNSILLKTRPDLVQIDFISYADLIHVIPTHIKTVLIHHEIRTARFESYLKTKDRPATAYEKYIMSYVGNDENTILEKFKAIIVFSKNDRERLENTIHSSKVYVSPFPVLEESFEKITEGNLNIKKLVFVGGENHYPNKDAVEWFIAHVLTKIRDYHKLELHIAGKWNPETIEKYKDYPFVHFGGYVSDLKGYCMNSIMVAPVRIGSGIRTKILYAMAQGIPVISTTLGCEGITVKDKESIVIADDPSSFLSGINYLLEDKNNISSIIKNAQQVIHNGYSLEAAGKIRSDCYRELLSN